jgi:hypothetical protein
MMGEGEVSVAGPLVGELCQLGMEEGWERSD